MISALMIGASSAIHQFHPLCCQSVPPRSAASQCPAVAPVSAAYQC
ncbi:unnamed protein product [Staurois parvus]|uniref:Uncharacterized protein n=1 Tax=Staurois parvus TaxID=386267 RepID=A0ABN9ET35_9NEOB|nr:unnamed protein product [Staurois parvus]